MFFPEGLENTPFKLLATSWWPRGQRVKNWYLSDFYKYQFLTLCPRGHQEVAKEVKFQKFDYKAEL